MSTTTKRRSTRTNAAKGRHSQGSLYHRSGIYQTSGGTLLVPAQAMRLLNKAAQLSSVAKRASSSETVWYRWQRDAGSAWPELRDWLYHERSEPPDGVEITQAMLDVRSELTLEKIVEAARQLSQAAGTQ